ncbi:MAG TPA: sugar phosphate isomerase/epimerase family protein [Chloroflexota bacterium]|jgi:inosose dehydratase|nr:sugar phosphate isomerase/epimerase family protein [Chloroflexota bacterium]
MAQARFAVGGAIFGKTEAEDVALIAKFRFPGFEPYRGQAMTWLDRPRELKRLLDDHGLTLITCSNGGPGQSVEFIDPAARQQTIEDHLAFARDFLGVFGCGHFKINMGRRPAGGTTDEQLRSLGETLNQLGRRTLEELGIKLGAHAHIWGPVERPHEIDAIMAGTDPRYVWFLPDTAQINLGGGDPVAIMERYRDRIVAVHFKDSRPEYRGWTGPTPTQEQHRERILYQDLGAGGVDHEAIWANLKRRGYDGWITLDLDPPRANEGEGTVEQKLAINHRYLFETLGVTSL